MEQPKCSSAAQVVLMPGEGAKPTLAVSCSRRAYDGGAPELDFGSPRNSSVFYASADVKGFHYDANGVFNEVLQNLVRRLQFGQTLSISHPAGELRALRRKTQAVFLAVPGFTFGFCPRLATNCAVTAFIVMFAGAPLPRRGLEVKA
jgi:hypothetical protein